MQQMFSTINGEVVRQVEISGPAVVAALIVVYVVLLGGMD